MLRNFFRISLWLVAGCATLAWASQTKPIAAGDLLKVSVTSLIMPEQAWVIEIRVDAEGVVRLPLAGRISVA